MNQMNQFLFEEMEFISPEFVKLTQPTPCRAGRVRLALRLSPRRVRRRGLRRPRPGGRPDAQGAAHRHPGQHPDDGLRFQPEQIAW